MEAFTTQDPKGWNTLVASLPGAHVLQTWEWAQIKAQTGWRALPQAWRGADGRVTAAVMLLQRSLRLPGSGGRLSVLYAPRGPLLDWNDAALRQRVLADLQTYARQSGAIFVKIDPEVVLGRGLPGTEDGRDDPGGEALAGELARAGWRFSDEQIQFRNTVWVDLTPPEDEILGRMKQKTRYNVRLAERKGVTVRAGGPEDLGWLYAMYAETSLRDSFVIRSEAYYRSVWGGFMQAGMAEPLIAEVDGEPVAAVILFRFAGTAWYLYGMSRQAHREKMPNHLLQWEAMRRARAAGCTRYDLWGAPDAFDEDDPLWGVYRFKEGLGGEVVRTLGAWDYPARSVTYSLYTRILPRILDVMRRRGRARTRQEVTAQ